MYLAFNPFLHTFMAIPHIWCAESSISMWCIHIYYIGFFCIEIPIDNIWSKFPHLKMAHKNWPDVHTITEQVDQKLNMLQLDVQMHHLFSVLSFT